jgi:HAD superfamily hydrolase (TIGR01509 family)
MPSTQSKGYAMYDHIIWDFDGTLYDTYPGMVEAFHRALAAENIHVDYEELGVSMRVSISKTQTRLHKKYGLSENFEEKYVALRDQIERERMPPFAHSSDVCKAIRDRGKKSYIYTHRDRTSLAHLAKAGLEDCFVGCISIEDKFPSKPNPAALLSLMEKYGLTPGECMMIGDRDIDIQAGKNAGMATCFFDPTGKTDPNATYNIKSLVELYAILNI